MNLILLQLQWVRIIFIPPSLEGRGIEGEGENFELSFNTCGDTPSP